MKPSPPPPPPFFFYRLIQVGLEELQAQGCNITSRTRSFCKFSLCWVVYVMIHTPLPFPSWQDLGVIEKPAYVCKFTPDSHHGHLVGVAGENNCVQLFDTRDHLSDVTGKSASCYSHAPLTRISPPPYPNRDSSLWKLNRGLCLGHRRR